jgi:hypothetical protein
MRIFDFLFGCRHAELSRVFTIGGRTYRVCCSCGSQFNYSLANMRMGGRFSEIAYAQPARPSAREKRELGDREVFAQYSV